MERIRNIKVKTQPCPFCGEPHYVMIDKQGLEEYKNGALIHRAFPYLTADERELLISGTCSDCWSNMKCGDDEE